MPAGYSGTPLGKKLGVKRGARTWRLGMPDSVAAEIAEGEAQPVLLDAPEAGLDHAHIFVTEAAVLERELGRLRKLLADDGLVWVSWPKQAAKMETEVGEHEVRKAGLAIGFVDTKKCAVDETWSGLKFVIRKENRGK